MTYRETRNPNVLFCVEKNTYFPRDRNHPLYRAMRDEGATPEPFEAEVATRVVNGAVRPDENDYMR